MNLQYSGKDFRKDGVGEATFSSCIDGDTATLEVQGEKIRVRFLGINTPESTGKIEAWGKTASKFTCGKIKEANKIILENEYNVFEKLDSSGGRYLGWVWYQPSSTADFRLLNLELVEEAYSKNQMFDVKSKYFNSFRAAEQNAKYSLERLYGEKNDPTFDYSDTAKEINISELLVNFDEYENAGSQLRVEVLIVSKVGNHLFVQDVNPYEDSLTGEVRYAGIYVFTGYNSGLDYLRPGWILKFYCKAGKFNDSVQLTDVKSSEFGSQKLIVVSKDNEIKDFIIDENTVLENYVGNVVQTEITVTDNKVLDPDGTSSYTVRANFKGTTKWLNLRINSEVSPKNYNFVVGKSYRVKGGLVKYYDNFQLMLGNDYNNDNAIVLE